MGLANRNVNIRVNIFIDPYLKAWFDNFCDDNTLNSFGNIPDVTSVVGLFVLLCVLVRGVSVCGFVFFGRGLCLRFFVSLFGLGFSWGDGCLIVLFNHLVFQRRKRKILYISNSICIISLRSFTGKDYMTNMPDILCTAMSVMHITFC